MDLGDLVSYVGVFFFYVIPWLLMLLAFGWIRDWVVNTYKTYKRKTEKVLGEGKSNRWIIILALTKILMFIVLILPVMAVIDYLFDDSIPDPAHVLFNETMWYVFMFITIWYMFAIIVIGVQKRSMQDQEHIDAMESRREKEE